VNMKSVNFIFQGRSYNSDHNLLSSSGPGTTIYGFDEEHYDSYINLLNLRARQLNTATGRFLEKDTWQGDDQQPGSYNKWLFTYANPINYTDPSGRSPITICLNPYGCGGEPPIWYQVSCLPTPIIPAPIPIPPTPVDQSKLSTIPGKTGVTGLGLYTWYLKMHTTYEKENTWWGKMFGSDGNYSIWDALVTIFVGELFDKWDEPNASEASVRVLQEWCHYHYSDENKQKSCSLEHFINSYAAQYQSAGTWVTANPIDINQTGISKKLTKDDYNNPNVNNLRKISQDYKNPPMAWIQGMDMTRPYGWANISIYSKDQQDTLLKDTKKLFAVLSGVPSKNTWIIPSGCVAKYWLDDDPKTYDLHHDCSDVSSGDNNQ
jgi:RHS repeat-associated protein